jgi:Fe-S cluster biogenesis protein NfuA
LLSDFFIFYGYLLITEKNIQRKEMIPFTDEELIAPVTKVIDKVRPSLALDGGDIDFITVKNATVYVQLKGACIGCASSGSTLKYGVERQLRMDIHPELCVVNVPIGMENDIDKL